MSQCCLAAKLDMVMAPTYLSGLLLQTPELPSISFDDYVDDGCVQAMRTPVRGAAGVTLLFKYYNQLYYIERRFFPPDRSLGVYFEWFDLITLQ